MAKKPPVDSVTSGLPFKLEAREQVTKIRKRDVHETKEPSGPRTQKLDGFEPKFVDIVDYIVRITDEIWADRAMGRIYDTYDSSCVVYSSYGVVRSVEEVMASTAATLNAYPDGEIHHLNVSWKRIEDNEFYTSHLGYSRSTNLGPSSYGPATGRRVGIRFCADCVIRANLIHTEWLVRDSGAQVRQLGLDVHDVARRLAAVPAMEENIVSVPTRLDGQAPRRPLDLPVDTMDGYVRTMFHDLWNLRRLDRLGNYYATDVVSHSSGGRVAIGLRNLSALILLILTSLPDATIDVHHICHAEETDGVIVSVRWTIYGTTKKGGVLGDAPEGKPVAMMGMSHLRFAGNRIVEEWTLFDEVGVLSAAYRA